MISELVGKKIMYLCIQIMTYLIILKSMGFFFLFVFFAGWLHRLC